MVSVSWVCYDWLVVPIFTPTGNIWRLKLHHVLTKTWCFSSFLTILVGSKNIIALWFSICISLMGNEVKHLFICSLVIVISFVNYLSKSFGLPFYFFFCLFRTPSQVGVESEPWPPAYATVTATPDPSCICNTCLSLTHWARPGIIPASSWILVGFLIHWVTVGTPN